MIMRDYPTLHLDTNKMNCELMLSYDTPAYMFTNSRFMPSIVAEKSTTKNIWDGGTEVKQYTPHSGGVGI